ncbi:hypothetical protein LCGC14_1342340 [marine sediment metagenome]|uniref:Uncharacterized protein n=1 Tax=marine sediment metagenome TaxID=412755 RepID=A0A0F9KZP1_9ZZZZ
MNITHASVKMLNTLVILEYCRFNLHPFLIDPYQAFLLCIELVRYKVYFNQLLGL